LYKTTLPTGAAVGGDHELRPRVVDPRREARGRESAEHPEWIAPTLAQARDDETPIRGSSHVDDHPVAAAHAQRNHHRRGALHLGVKARPKLKLFSSPVSVEI